MASVFPDTPWSLIAQAAGGHGDRRDLLRQLLERYWQPVYRTLRSGWNLPEPEARQLVQVFLGRLLDPEVLAELDPDKTRFRDFLKSKLHAFMAAHEAGRSGVLPSSTPFELTELVQVPDSAGDPDEVFDEQWALLVIHRALSRLEDATRARQRHLYEVFMTWDVRGERPPDEALARSIGIDAEAVQAALQLSRRMFRRFVVGEVHEYAADQDRAREELRWLLH